MIDYPKLRERLTKISKSLTRPHITFDLDDAEELISKAEKWDKADVDELTCDRDRWEKMGMKLKEERDKAVKKADDLGMAMAQIHASILTGNPLPDGISILHFIADIVNSGDPAPVEEGKR